MNTHLSDLIPEADEAHQSVNQYMTLPPGETSAAAMKHSKIPISNFASSVTNRDGNKFTRGWLNGAGGSVIDQNLGSLAYDVRPAPYNNRVWSDFASVVPKYGAPVAGLANIDVEAPGRTWNPAGEARAEWVPSTWTNKLEGLDIVSGHLGPRVMTAFDPILSSPTPQFYAEKQMQEGGWAHPSYPFGGRTKKPLIDAIQRKGRTAFAEGSGK